MKLIDDLHQEPKQAFTGACIMAVGALRWAVELTEPHGVRLIPVIAAGGFTLAALALALRGRQMQREEARRSGPGA